MFCCTVSLTLSRSFLSACSFSAPLAEEYVSCRRISRQRCEASGNSRRLAHHFLLENGGELAVHVELELGGLASDAILVVEELVDVLEEQRRRATVGRVPATSVAATLPLHFPLHDALFAEGLVGDAHVRDLVLHAVAVRLGLVVDRLDGRVREVEPL